MSGPHIIASGPAGPWKFPHPATRGKANLHKETKNIDRRGRLDFLLICPNWIHFRGTRFRAKFPKRITFAHHPMQSHLLFRPPHHHQRKPTPFSLEDQKVCVFIKGGQIEKNPQKNAQAYKIADTTSLSHTNSFFAFSSYSILPPIIYLYRASSGYCAL